MIFKLRIISIFFIGLAMFSGILNAAEHKEGDFIFRVGAAFIEPNDSSSNVLSANDGISVDSASSFGFSATWMLTDNWGLELLAGLPFEHDINGSGSLQGLAIGSTKQVPPTVSFQYYPDLEFESFIPYFGIGVNYTKFFSEETSTALQTTLGTTDVDLDLDDSVGLIAQLGFDYEISDNLYFNSSISYMNIDTEATVRVNGATATIVNVEINPWVTVISIGWKF